MKHSTFNIQHSTLKRYMLVALLACLGVWTARGSEGDVTGPVTAGQIAVSGAIVGRTFYVATNGNNGSAVINDPTHPWAPVFTNTAGVCNLATNAGDVIYLQSGVYSNVFFLYLTNGVSLTGPKVWPPSAIITATNTSSGALPGTIQASENNLISYIAWYGFPSNGFSSFITPNAACTNVVVDHVLLHGQSDVFYSTTIGPGLTIQNSYVDSIWDILVNSITPTTRNDVFVALNSWSPTRFLAGAGYLDVGSTFSNFLSTAQVSPSAGVWQLNGTRFYSFGTNDTLPFAITSVAYGSFYYDAGRGLWFTPELGFSTNSITTNVVNTYFATNLYPRSYPDANANAVFMLSNVISGSLAGPGPYSCVAVWTNVNRYTYKLNDPAINTSEGVNCAAICNASGVETYVAEIDTGMGENNIATNNWNTPGFAAPVTGWTGLATNSITTNYVYAYSQYFSGNGAGLTNLTSLAFTNSGAGYLTTGGFKSVTAAGTVYVTCCVTNAEIAWLTNQTTHDVVIMGNVSGVWTNFDNASLPVNSGDSIAVTNVSGGNALLVTSRFYSLH